MDKTEFYRILKMTKDDGHPHWPSKIPNQELVKQGIEVVPYLIEALNSEHAGAAVMTFSKITDPNYQSMLKGKGFKYEMWGIY